MSEDKDQWIDSVLNSIEGSQKASPSKDLLARIESQIDGHGRVVKITQVQKRWTAAAAILLLALNGFALQRIFQGKMPIADNPANGESYQISLISDYQIYEP